MPTQTTSTNRLLKRSGAMRALCGLALLVGTPQLAHAEEKAEVKYAQVNGVKLAYYTRGKGEPLLMIMGFGATMSMWDPALLDTLAKNHRLILFDNRGIGLSSDTTQDNTTMQQMADDAAGLVEALGFKKTNILAWSMGARIGQQFVIRHPDLTNKAVLCAANPGGKYEDPTDKDVEAELSSPTLPLMDNVALLYPKNAAGQQAARDTVARVNAAKVAGTIPDDFEIPAQGRARQEKARALWKVDNSNFEALKSIKVPVLLSDGRDDIIDKPRNSLIIANQIPFAWLAFFEGGHAFMFQQHEKFAETVNVFLK